MKWLIYKHTLTVDCEHKGWSYIGQTYLDVPEKRWGKNGTGYFSQLFYKAIKKYSWESFSHEILEDNILTQELANEREKYWISFYHTYIKDDYCKGYNMTPGGEQWGNLAFNWYNDGRIEICIPKTDIVPEGFKLGRLPMSEEQKQKLKNHQISDAQRMKISEKNSDKVHVYNRNTDIEKAVDSETAEYLVNSCGYIYGRRPYLRSKRQNVKKGWHTRARTDEEKAHLRELNLGKKHTDTTKKKMSESQKGKRWFTDDVNFIKSEICPEGWFPGAPPITEETKEKIKKAITGIKRSDTTKKKISEANKGKNLGKKPVNSITIKCIETGEIFYSITEAVKKTGYKSISKSIKTGVAIGKNKYDKNKVHFIIWED